MLSKLIPTEIKYIELNKSSKNIRKMHDEHI